MRLHRASAAQGSHPLQGPLVSVGALSHWQGQVQHEIRALAGGAQHASPCCSSVQRTLIAVRWWAEVLSGDEVDDRQCCCQLPRPGILQAAVFVIPSAAQQSCQSATPLWGSWTQVQVGDLQTGAQLQQDLCQGPCRVSSCPKLVADNSVAACKMAGEAGGTRLAYKPHTCRCEAHLAFSSTMP